MSSNIFVNRVCQWCGKEFVARTTTTNYCSHRCSGLAYKERKRQAKLEKVQEEFERVKGCPPELEKQEFLTPRQAARVIGICYKTIYNYINNGSLKTELNPKSWTKQSLKNVRQSKKKVCQA